MHYIEDVRVIEPDARSLTRVDWLPDGRTSLVIRVLGARGDVSIAGPRTNALYKNISGVARAVTVRFKPGWSPFRVPMTGLTNRFVKLEDLWGSSARELSDALVSARSTREVVDRLSAAFALRTRDESASALLARRAARLLESTEARVESVAQQLGVTSRHLRRAFAESVGIGPKEFARTVRLQRALREAARSTDWARIAVQAGYYDQAHLIADFKALVGLTPGAFVKRAG